MIKSIHGRYIPASKYEAAAVIIVALTWSEDQPYDLLSKIFDPAKAEALMKTENPIHQALLELSSIAELGTPVETIIDELSKITIDFDQFIGCFYDKHITRVAGSLARHDLDDAIQYCCADNGLVGPYDIQFYGAQ